MTASLNGSVTLSKPSIKLDAVSKARQAYVLARTTLEQRLREQMREELANLQTQVDIAVRYAYDSGESKASIMRAMGTKDFNTMKACLERTQSVAEVVGADPLAGVYELIFPSVIQVNYENHGPNNFTGKASFTFKKLDDGSILFMSTESLWNSDFTVRNDAVAALDGKSDGWYYEEACQRLSSSSS
jgi:hypothetical protein